MKGIYMKNKLVLIPLVIMILSLLGIILTIYFESKNNIITETPNFEIKNDLDQISGDFSNTYEMPSDEEISNDGDVSRPNREEFKGISSTDKPNNEFDFQFDSNMPQRDDKKLSTLGIIIISFCALLFTVALLYLLNTKFCTSKLLLKDDKLIIFVLESLIISIVLIASIILITNNYAFDGNKNRFERREMIRN